MGSGGIGKKKQADVPADGGIDKVRLVYVELVHNNAPFEELFQIDFGGWRAFFRAVKDFAEDPTSALSECIATGILQKNGIAFKDWGKKVRERSPAFKEQFNRFIHLPAVRYALATDLGMDPAATDLTDADGRSGPGGPSMNPAAIRDRDRYEPANDSYDERAGAGGSQQPRRPYSPSEGGYTANADSSMPAESRYHARKRADPDSPTSPMLDRLEMLLSSSPVDGPDSPIERLQRTLDEKDPEPPRGTAALGAGPATARRQFAGAGYAAMAARSPPPPPTTTAGGGALDVDAAFAAATVTSPNGSVGGGVRNVSTPGVPGNLVQARPISHRSPYDRVGVVNAVS
jgi:hypothetical protein